VPQEESRITAGDTGVSGQTRAKILWAKRVLENSRVDTKNWFDHRMPHDSLVAEAHRFAAPQRKFFASDHAGEAWEGATADDLPLGWQARLTTKSLSVTS
jgi:hypothetical protein